MTSRSTGPCLPGLPGAPAGPPDRPDRPSLVVRPDELVSVDPGLGRLRAIPGSQMFEIRKALEVFAARHPDELVVDASQGDGGASLPGVAPEVLDMAHALQRSHGTAYDGPAGADLFRRAVAELYWRLDRATGWGPANVIACQGGRDALLRAYDAVQLLGHGRRGDLVVVSRVPWISYSWGPYAVGANVMLAPGEEHEAWQLRPEAVQACIEMADRELEGRRIAALVLTSPDNPTGRSMALERQIELTRATLESGVPYVILDWIYHQVTEDEPHDLNRFLLALEPALRERCIILDGITKSLGASNIRNAHLVASEAVVGFIASRASHGVIPSFHSQAVAIAAYRQGLRRAARGVLDPTNASRRLVRRFISDHRLRAVLGDGYYAFIDVGPSLDRAGLADSKALGTILAERRGLAIVPGGCFGPAGSRWIRFSYALEPTITQLACERLWQGLQELEHAARA